MKRYSQRYNWEVKSFHLGDVLSITDGHLVSPEGIGGVYQILNYMTGDDLYTHQIPRVMDECRPHLLQQHPHLAHVQFPDGLHGEAGCRAWLDEQVVQFGETLPVEPIPRDEHRRVNALAELEALLPGRVIAVVPGEQ